MKVFVDLRHVEQLYTGFAFFDTVTSTFDDFDGEQTFDNWYDFLEWWTVLDNHSQPLERYKRLCPKWVFMGFKEYRVDGWPMCPKCGNDELYCMYAVDFFNLEGKWPNIDECIELGLHCHFCYYDISTDDILQEM